MFNSAVGKWRVVRGRVERFFFFSVLRTQNTESLNIHGQTVALFGADVISVQQVR